MKDMLKSKKFRALLIGIVATLVCQGFGLLANKIGVDITPETAMDLSNAAATKIVAVVSAYLVGQGAADFGKEAKKAEAAVEGAS